MQHKTTLITVFLLEMSFPHSCDDGRAKIEYLEDSMGRERYRAEHRRLELIEVAALLRWSRRHRPAALRIQGIFSGWPYPISDQELWYLAQSLGGVAFRPASIDD